MKIKRNCLICNKEFFSYSYYNSKFCSVKCMGIWNSKNRIGDKHWNWQGGKIKRICNICNKEFYINSSKIKKGFGKYCSRNCFAIGMVKKIKVNCKICNKDFFIYPSKIKFGQSKFCSRQCFGKSIAGENNSSKRKEVREKISKSIKKTMTSEHRKILSELAKGRIVSIETRNKISKAFKGENHPNWQGGISKKPYSFNFNKELKESILKRDNFICQECKYPQSKLEENLSIHHIDYNKHNNIPINLISLCRSCHMKTNYTRNKWITYYQEKVLQ